MAVAMSAMLPPVVVLVIAALVHQGRDRNREVTRNQSMGSVVLDDARKSFGRSEVIKGVTTQGADGELRVRAWAIALRRVDDPAHDRRARGDLGRHHPHRASGWSTDWSPRIATLPWCSSTMPSLRTVGVRQPGLQPAQSGHGRDRAPHAISLAASASGAIVREAAVSLFDEPLSNLDAKLRVKMRIKIKTLQQHLGTTGICVTHDQGEATTLGDQLMVISASVVEQIGPPLEVCGPARRHQPRRRRRAAGADLGPRPPAPLRSTTGRRLDS